MLARFGTLHLQKDIDQLERVQKFALRMCAKQWDLGYAELLNLFNVPSLMHRRKYLNLCTMYKIVHNLVYFPHGVFVPRITTSRSASKLLYYQPFTHTNAFLRASGNGGNGKLKRKAETEG